MAPFLRPFFVSHNLEKDSFSHYFRITLVFTEDFRLSSALASAGVGVKWPLWKDASINVVSAFPLIRDLEAGVPINKVRFDVAVTAVW